MESITSCCSNTPAYGDLSAVSKNVNAAQYSKIEASSSQSKDITLYTEEGDKVTLSYNQESSLTYANLSAMSYGFDFSSDENQAMVKETLARLEAEMFSFNAGRDITLSVEGNLNEQELSDIKTALKGIDEIMTDLLNGGDISEAMSEAEDIKDLDTIAGLEADYKYERSISIERAAVQQTEIYEKYSIPENATYSEPAAFQEPEIYANNNISENMTASRHGHRGKSFMKRLDRMADWIEKSHVNPSRFLKPMKNMFKDIQNRFGEDTPIHRAKKNISRLFGRELSSRIHQLTEDYAQTQNKSDI